MPNNTPETTPRRNALVMLAELRQQPEADKRLSIYGRVAVGADRQQGKPLRYREGMTLQDAVIITGLPSAEASRRIREMGTYSDPEIYAAHRLCEGAGEKYLAEQAAVTKPEHPESSPPKSAEIIQLSFWGEDYRAAPNAVFRSALFPALNPKQKTTRRFLDEEEVFSVAGLKILFTGKQFDQSDLDVYLEILNMAQPYPLGTPITFSAYALLKALGLTTGGENHARLHKVLIRLCGGVVDATDHGTRYFGQLLHGGMRDELTMTYTVRINPEFAVLFGATMWGKLDLKTRRALGRKDVAKVLQAYYSTHLNPSFHDLETLYGLTGLKGINRKRDILKAHAALQAVGFCEDYELNKVGTGIRLINMTQHPSQHRAMVKQVAKGKPRRRNTMTAAADLLSIQPKTPKK